MSKKILVVAAHPDDEVLGCGGVMAKHALEGNEVAVLFVADGVSARNSKQLDVDLKERKKSAHNALEILGAKPLEFLDFPDNRLDSIPLLDIVQKIEASIHQYRPEIIYTHHYGDLNIDHAITHRATLTACRPLPSSSIKQIYTYEVLSATEWALGTNIFSPNYYVNVADFLEKKIKALQAYGEEIPQSNHPRSIEALRCQGALRGASVGRIFCEAFQLIRAIHD